MKFLEKVAITIFSILALVVSIIMILLYFNIIGSSTIIGMLNTLSTGNIGIVVLAISLIIILLAVKCLFFGSKIRKDRADGVLLENSNGKLLITRETLENLVSSVSKNIVGAESIASKIALDRENNLSVLVTITISQDTNIKDLSNSLQTTIKDAIKKTADLDVKEVNIKVKNINMKNKYANSNEEKNETSVEENNGGQNE